MKRIAALALAAAAVGCEPGPSLTQGPRVEAARGAEVCGVFEMPNPAGSGLPHAQSYVDGGDGTITDRVTDLVWQRDVAEIGMSQFDAGPACAARGDGWRLPTRLELLTLVDYDVAAPGPTINAIFRGAPGAVFWTSSGYAGNSGDAWVVGFDRGYADYGVRNNPSLVRCVRATVVHCLPSRYEVLPQGLVIDHSTQLIWQRVPDARSFTWPDAKAYCATLGVGWRLPSLTELQTIVEDKNEYPAIDLETFPGTESVDFWTATPDAAGSGSVWYVDFFYGASDNDVAAREYRVRCVR